MVSKYFLSYFKCVKVESNLNLKKINRSNVRASQDASIMFLFYRRQYEKKHIVGFIEKHKKIPQ